MFLFKWINNFKEKPEVNELLRLGFDSRTTKIPNTFISYRYVIYVIFIISFMSGVVLLLNIFKLNINLEPLHLLLEKKQRMGYGSLVNMSMANSLNE